MSSIKYLLLLVICVCIIVLCIVLLFKQKKHAEKFVYSEKHNKPTNKQLDKKANYTLHVGVPKHNLPTYHYKLHHVTNEKLISQYFCELILIDDKVPTKSQTIHALFDTGSASFVCRDLTVGTNSPIANIYNVYGPKPIPQHECTPKNPLYKECAYMSWKTVKLGDIPLLAGTVLEGGVPNLFGVANMNTPHDALNWKHLKNITIDFPNTTFTLNDDDDANEYIMIPRVIFEPQYYCIKPLAISFNLKGVSSHKQLDPKLYTILFDTGTPISGFDSSIYDLFTTHSERLHVKVCDNVTFRLTKYQDMGNSGLIVIGNVYLAHLKLLLTKEYVGLSIPLKIAKPFSKIDITALEDAKKNALLHPGKDTAEFLPDISIDKNKMIHIGGEWKYIRDEKKYQGLD